MKRRREVDKVSSHSQITHGDSATVRSVGAMSEAIEVHELTDRPTDYWRAWKKTANVMRLQVRQPTSPPSEDKVNPDILIISF